MQPPPSQDPNAGPWMRKYLSAILADPTLQATHAGSLPVWLEQQIDPALERGQGAPPRITIQQAVSRCPALVLLGPAGSGKSTLLRQLVRELAQEALNNPQAPLPLYVPLTFFAGSIEGTLAAQARMRGPTLATLALTRPCILIVDALNDLPPAEQVPVLGMLRRALSSLGPQGRWIIACRSEAWGLFDAWLPGGRFQVWRVRPWSDQAIANAVQRQGNPAGERLLRFPGAIELARRPRWLGAFLQLGTAPEGEGTRAAALGGLPGPLLLKWIRATAAEAARTHCLSDLCPEIAVTLLQDLGVMFQRDPLLNGATIANMVADAATAADLPVGDVQALLEALALLHPAGDDEWTFRSPLLGDLNVALDLCADAKELGLRVEERALSGDTTSAPSPQSLVLMAPRTALALLFGMLPSGQPLLRMLIRAGAWEATQEVLDANVGPDEALAALEETGQIDSATAAALGRAWAQGGSPEVAIALLEWTVRQGRDDPYLFGLIGHLHRQAGNWSDARTAFEEALRRDPANLDYQQALAHVCQELGEADTATTTLEGLLAAHHGRLAAAAFQLGSLRENQGKLAEALDQYTRAAALCPRGSPDEGHFQLAKARVLRRLGRHEEAGQILRSIDDETADAVALADENAALLEATGHDLLALQRLGQIEALGSATPDTFLRMAELHRRRDEHPEAERAYRAAIELDPRCVEAYEGVAELAAMAGDIPTAVSAYERIVDIEPGSAEAWRRLGAFQRQAGHYAESSRSLQTSLRIAVSPETQLELARTRWAQGDQVAALSHYRSAASNDPDGRMSAEAGWALLESGDLAAAQAMLERAAALRPADGRVLYDLGRCHEAQGTVSRALEWFMQAAHVAPSATTLRATGRTARLLGEHAMARQMLARAFRADRRSGETAAEIGRLHLEEGRADLASAALRRARAAGVEDLEVQRDLAEALLRLGDAQGALHILEAITVDDNDIQTKRSRAYEMLGDPQRALGIARAAAARQPRSATLQRRVGALALQAGVPGEALVALEAARALGDKEPSTLVDLSRAMLLTGRLTTALRTIDEALLRMAADQGPGAGGREPGDGERPSRSPTTDHQPPTLTDEVRSHVQRGQVLLALEDWAEARRAFERALALVGDGSQGTENGTGSTSNRQPATGNAELSTDPRSPAPVPRPLVAEAWAGLAEAQARIAGPGAALPYARHALELMPLDSTGPTERAPYLRLVGRLLLEAGDYEGARQTLAGDPTAEPATLRLRLRVEIAAEQWDAAVPLAARCHAITPHDLGVTADYGTALLHAGQPTEALPLLETVCTAPSAAPAWWATLGRCHLRLGNTEAAIEAFNRSLEGQPYDPRTHADLASAHVAQGTYAGAVHAYRQALELGGERVEWRAALARACAAQGWYAEALAEWERARELAPDDTTLRLDIAQAHLNLGDPEPALVDLEALVADHPDCGPAWQLLSRAALVAGTPSRAVYAAACALSQKPQDAGLRVLLAEAALADGDARRALDTLAPLVEAQEPNVKALLLVHQAANRLQDPAAARSALEQAGRIAPGNPEVQLAIAEHLQATGEGPRALKLLRNLFTRHSDSPSIAASLAQQAFKGGDIELAREAAERAVSLAPHDPAYARLFGHICYEQGDHVNARRALQQAMKGRQDPMTALLLGKLALARGEPSEAGRFLRLAHEHRPDDPETTGWLALALRQPFEPVLEDEAPEPQKAPPLDAALLLLRKVERVPVWRAELGWTLVICGDYLEALSMLGSASRAEELPGKARVATLRRVGLVLLTLRRAGDALTPLERARELDPSDAAVCSLLGQIAEVQRDLHAAIQHYGNATALEPENGRHHLRLGLALLNAGETEAALEHLGRSTELEPARAAAWTAYSQGLLRTRRIDRAYSAAQRAVQIAPTDGHAWRQLAAVAEARNDVRGALDALERAVALAPAQRAAGNRWQGAEEAGSSPTADRQMPSVQKEWLLYYGNLAIAHGETERGRIALQAASDLDPNDADLLHQLAQFHGSAERVALLQRAVALKPTEAAWRTELAELLVARGEHRPALDHLKHAIEAEPRRSAHWIALAHAYMEAGDDAAAEATLRRAEATVDPDAAVYVALGDLLSEQGRWDEALQAYIEAGRLAPSADYHTECGRCLQAMGRFDEAREALEHALELEPTNARAATHLAEVHLLRDTQDGWKTAIKYARIATEYAPGELAGYKVQARAALGGRWKDEVKTALEHAYAIAPDDPELHELQGWYYFHEGKNEIALLEAERAIEFDPESASAYYLQAQVLRRQQRFMEAIAALRTAVHLDRNFKEAIKELTALGLEALIHSGRK